MYEVKLLGALRTVEYDALMQAQNRSRFLSIPAVNQGVDCLLSTTQKTMYLTFVLSLFFYSLTVAVIFCPVSFGMEVREIIPN